MDLVDRGSSKQPTTKAALDMPKTFLEGMALLLTAVSKGAYRDGMFAVSSLEGCPLKLVELVNGLVAGVTASMHPAFACQSSKDTVGFTHMLMRYMGQLPPAGGGASCAPLSSETQQMVVTFLRDCLGRHYTGLDLQFVTSESLSSDMATAVTRELVRRAGTTSSTDTSNKKKKPNPTVPTSVSPWVDGGCRDFRRGTCYRGDACRYTHAQGGASLPPPPGGAPFRPTPAPRGGG